MELVLITALHASQSVVATAMSALSAKTKNRAVRGWSVMRVLENSVPQTSEQRIAHMTCSIQRRRIATTLVLVLRPGFGGWAAAPSCLALDR